MKSSSTFGSASPNKPCDFDEKISVSSSAKYKNWYVNYVLKWIPFLNYNLLPLVSVSESFGSTLMRFSGAMVSTPTFWFARSVDKRKNESVPSSFNLNSTFGTTAKLPRITPVHKREGRKNLFSVLIVTIIENQIEKQ